MDSFEASQWIKEQHLHDKAKEAAVVLKKVFTPCLAVQNEKILIIGDQGVEDRQLSPVLSAGYYLAAKDLNLDAKLMLQPVKARGDEAADFVIQSLTELKEGVIILNMSDKLGSIGKLGKSFRKFIRKMNHRFVSAMGLGDLKTEELSTFLGSVDIPYKAMQVKSQALKELFDTSKVIRVTTPAGTDLEYNIEGIEGIKADGDYTQPGKGGNLPAGEVYAPPNGTKVNGKIVIDGSYKTREHTRLITTPITLTVQDGDIIKVEGEEEAKELERGLGWAASIAKNPGSVRRICEFGIGLNPKASVRGAMIIDDKTLQTAHIGIGSNYWFGGTIYATIHWDQVMKDPTITFDGKPLEW